MSGLEPVGFTVSILTITNCMKLLGKVARTYKDHSERLDRLNTMLMGIRLNADMIPLCLEQWERELQSNNQYPAQPNESHPTDEHIGILFRKSSKSLGRLARRLENEIMRLDCARKQKQGFFQRLCTVFKKTSSSVQLVLGLDQLGDLISATKSVEVSLGITLTVLLSYQYKVQSMRQETFAEEVRGQFHHQTKNFKKLQRRLESYQDPMTTWKWMPPANPKPRISQSRRELNETPIISSASSKDRVRNEQALLPHQIHDASFEGDQAEDAIAFSKSSTTSDDRDNIHKSRKSKEIVMELNSNLEQEVLLRGHFDENPMAMKNETKLTRRKHRKSKPKQELNETPIMSATFSEDDPMSSESSMFSHDIQDDTLEDGQAEGTIDSSTLPTMLVNGIDIHGFEAIESISTRPDAGLDQDVLTQTAPDMNSSVVMSLSEHSGSHSDTESYTPSVSDAEDKNWDQPNEFSLFDSNDIRVQSTAHIRMSVDIDLSICFRAELEVWKFCTKSLLLPNSGGAIFVLQNPCNARCDHISVQSEPTANLDIQDLSQDLEVFLCDRSTDMASSTTMEDWLPDIFTAVSYPSPLNNLRTALFNESNMAKWIVGRSELSMIVNSRLETGEGNNEEAVNEEEVNEEEVDEEDVNEEEVNEEKDQSGGDSPDEKPKSGPYFSVPCFFCQQDAFNPWCSEGAFAEIPFRGKTSFLVTCNRCKNNILFPAMEWKPSSIVGYWLLGWL